MFAMETEISPEQMETYKRTARERQAQYEQETAERRARAWSAARQAARVLKEKYGAAQVIAFGSLVHQAWFHAGSDIDLAVKGISPDDFFHVWAKLDYLGIDFEIDLMNYELAPDHLRQVIDAEGIEL